MIAAPAVDDVACTCQVSWPPELIGRCPACGAAHTEPERPTLRMPAARVAQLVTQCLSDT